MESVNYWKKINSLMLIKKEVFSGEHIYHFFTIFSLVNFRFLGFILAGLNECIFIYLLWKNIA